MIKKWVIGAVAYLIIVIVGFSIYTSIVEPEPMNMDQQDEMHEK